MIALPMPIMLVILSASACICSSNEFFFKLSLRGGRRARSEAKKWVAQCGRRRAHFSRLAPGVFMYGSCEETRMRAVRDRRVSDARRSGWLSPVSAGVYFLPASFEPPRIHSIRPCRRALRAQAWCAARAQRGASSGP